MRMRTQRLTMNIPLLLCYTVHVYSQPIRLSANLLCNLTEMLHVLGEQTGMKLSFIKPSCTLLGVHHVHYVHQVHLVYIMCTLCERTSCVHHVCKHHVHYVYIIYIIYIMNNHVHRALLENTYTERMRKEKDKKGNAQKRLTLLNK